jgi:Protein of unknown function (DUF3604)
MIRSLTVRGSTVPPGLLAMFVFLVFGVVPARAQETDTLDKDTAAKVFPKKPYSPYVGQSYPTHVYFGDTHLHTSQSMDAVMFGTRLGPEDAYRFARGEEVTSSTGQRVQLSRPLDFLVVADHAESLGAMSAVLAGDPELMGDSTLKRWHDLMNQGCRGRHKSLRRSCG